MKKILFISPIDRYKENDLQIGLLSLATILKENNYDVEILDFYSLYENKILDKSKNFVEVLDDLSNYIISLNPHIVSFYSICNSFHNTIEVAKRVKQSSTSIKVLLGGPHATLCCKEILESFNCIDGIGIGEGENTILQIIESLALNKDLSTVNGFGYRDANNKVIINENNDLIKNLDDIPFLDYSLIDLDKQKTVSIDVGRGCPFGCKYCSTKTFWKRKFRLKSPERIVKEVKYLYDKFDKKNFGFVHDLFTANKSKFIEFCEVLAQENLDINWSCSGRLDNIDEDMIKSMKLAGCNAIFLGIETGSQSMQAKINKNLKLDTLWDTLYLLKKYNISTVLSFIYGFPGETEEDLKQTISLITDLANKGFINCQLHFFTVLPGTEFYEELKDELYYSGKCSDLADAVNIENSTEMIINNKLIFPQFLDFTSDLREKYKSLDRFINQFYLGLYNTLRGTYMHIRRYYNNDLLKFYLDFVNYSPDFFEKIYSNEDYLLNKVSLTELFLRKVLIIKDFINSHDFGSESNFLRSIANFEYDCLIFIQQKHMSLEYKTYDYNVIKLKQSIDINNTFEKTRLEFYKDENNKIKIHKLN